jgi:anti-sigma regulatory factor (Ser/Thr protein kinase)
MPVAGRKFELSLRTDLSELESMEEWVRHVAEQLELREEVHQSVLLCLVEVVTNVIVHGGESQPNKDIALSIEGLKDVVTARVTDHARPFDPLSYVPSPAPTSVEEAPIGGNGIRFIRHFATALSYKRRGNRNCLTLTFQR